MLSALRARLRDPEWVPFTTPTEGRVFLTCDGCGRVVPHYHAAYSAEEAKQRRPGCRACGHAYFRVTRIPEWKAAWWLLVVGVLWRKTIRGMERWDPRTPVLPS